MADTRLAKLSRVAKAGGSENERAMAARALQSASKALAVPVRDLAIRSEEADDRWSMGGVLTRDRKGARAHLRGQALRYFLISVREGEWFTNRTIPLHETDFGAGDFYLILSWLMPLGLCEKDGTRYMVASVAAVRKEWNRMLESAKV